MGCGCLILLWRLSGLRPASAFDGGYGLLFDGRWNTVGYAVTYCATSPSLCVLEKLVHVDDPALLPDLAMISYDAPHDTGIDAIGLDELPNDWRIPQRTRRHRAEKDQRLTVDESDRAVRLVRVQTLAEEAFGDNDKANLWLRRPLTELHGESPLMIAQTEAGARVIETILGKIAWGAAA